MRLTALLALVFVPLALAAAPAPKAAPSRVLVVSAYKDGNYDVFLVQPATGEVKNLTENKAADTDPIWSPDGARIAFVSDREGGPDIWTMKPDGSDLAQLTKKQGKCSGLKWSPDGSRIAFVSPVNNVDQVHTVELKTGKVTQVTNAPTASKQPAWSPDGERLSIADYGGRYYTYSVTADGRDKVRFTDANGGLDANWSPDGKRIAYVAITGTEGGWRLFTVGADGKDRKQLTKTANTYGNVYPRWSPDGKRISFGELDANGVLQVAVMDSDGGEPKVITTGPAMHVYTRWSPDGRALSYNRVEKDKPWALVVSAADGSDAKELIRNVGGIAEWKPR